MTVADLLRDGDDGDIRFDVAIVTGMRYCRFYIGADKLAHDDCRCRAIRTEAIMFHARSCFSGTSLRRSSRSRGGDRNGFVVVIAGIFAGAHDRGALIGTVNNYDAHRRTLLAGVSRKLGLVAVFASTA